MKIGMDQKEYVVEDDTIEYLFDKIEQFTLEQYSKLPDVAKIAGQAATRAFLLFAEKNEKDKDKRALFKPERKADPTVHVLHLLVTYIKYGVKQVYAKIDTTPNNRVVGIQLSSTGGGQLPLNGNKGERQDDSGETPRQYVVEGLPVPSAFHSGRKT